MKFAAAALVATMILGTFAQAEQVMQCKGVMIADDEAYDANIIVISELNDSAVTLFVNGEKLTGKTSADKNTVEVTNAKGERGILTSEEIKSGDETDKQFIKLTAESFDENNQSEGTSSGILTCEELK